MECVYYHEFVVMQFVCGLLYTILSHCYLLFVYILIAHSVFYYSFYIFYFLFFFLFFVFCVFVLFCVLFLLVYIVSLLFVNKFTDHHHCGETQL